jgi:hypothetical protein
MMIRRYGGVGNWRVSAVESLKIGVIHAGAQTVLSEANRHVVCPDRQETAQSGADEQVAKQKYHALMVGRQPVTDDTAVYAVLFQLLGWDKEHRAGSRHEFYKRHIVSFAEHVGDTSFYGTARIRLRFWDGDEAREG